MGRTLKRSVLLLPTGFAVFARSLGAGRIAARPLRPDLDWQLSGHAVCSAENGRLSLLDAFGFDPPRYHLA